jgi:ribosomal protection tetracycline resistance protein
MIPSCWYYINISTAKDIIMKKLVIGILAHVDAGKTTLSEGLLYLSGRIRKMGRVDNKDAYLDNYELERARGITIFSKQAVFDAGDARITLLDTPGHVDFSAEMERTLQVLDYAILVISGADGVQGHTRTLWRLLWVYQIPVFIFINKMDQDGTDKAKIMEQLKKQLDDGCIEFGQDDSERFSDQLAMCDESLMEAYLENGDIGTEMIKTAIRRRKVFPCFFGSALKLDGVEEFLQALVTYSQMPSYPEEFGAKIFKITRDGQGNRLTHMKITGGRLRVRDTLGDGSWEEKVSQIRIYSGSKFESVGEAEAGTVCAAAGLTHTRPGEGLGADTASGGPILEPVLSYQIILPEGCDPKAILPKLRQLEEESPELSIVWDEYLKEIRVQIMGQVQTEILQSLIKSRFGIDVSFGSGRILYKETIADTVEGVGHFEPLRHYAEVHLLMEPGERGSGLVIAEDCGDDVLARNWKNLILSHLHEKVHKGVLTGSPITDMKITLVSGRAHNKHTQGGDFREAAYRAVRQGLKEAVSVLLEPYYAFRLELPEKFVGHAMADIEKMSGTCRVSEISGDTAVLEGSAPVALMQNYQREVTAYTKGLGRLFCTLQGYGPCHNTQDVIAEIGYDSERDTANPTGSVFCGNGTSFIVSWDRVKDYMHLESCLAGTDHSGREAADKANADKTKDDWISQEEVDSIFKRTFFANQGKKTSWKKRKAAAARYHPLPAASALRSQKSAKPVTAKNEYLLVDGYNIIFAWPELKELAAENMDGARAKLTDQLSRYQHYRKCRIIIVFDAYRVSGHNEEMIDYGNVFVVFTREAQTADQFIEKFAHRHQDKYDITVATSDNLQQIIIRGAGSAVMSARELKEEVDNAGRRIMQAYDEIRRPDRNYLGDALSGETRQQIDEIANRPTGQ